MIGNSIAGFLGTGVAVSASSYESIATYTATGGETAFTFSSIPSTFKSLQIRGLARNTPNVAGVTGYRLTFNGDTTANYATHYLQGDGGAVNAVGAASTTRITIQGGEVRGATTHPTIYAGSIIDILDYASTTKTKTIRAFAGGDVNGVAAGVIALNSGLWNSTAAVTSLTITVGSTSFAASTTFALYGIKG